MNIIKKLLTILLITLFLLPSQTISATESQDQNDGCAAPTGGDSLSDVAKFPMYQVFAPTMNRLTKARLLFSAVNTPTITLTIKDMGGNSLGQTSAIISSGWIDFTFASALTLVPGLSYQIYLTREPAANATWNYCQPAGYGGGYAVTGGTIIPDKDYNFQTYGYNQQSAVSSQPAAVIEPPTNLKAEDIAGDTGGKIKLTWMKSSTSGIDGYRIYRRNDDEKDFTKIADVGAKFLDYEDTDLENGQEYVYVVRAIKETSESVNSNEARARAENNLAPPTPSNLHLVSKSKDYLEVAWDRVDDEKLDKYVVRWGESHVTSSALRGESHVTSSALRGESHVTSSALRGESPFDILTEKELSKDNVVFRADNLKNNTRYYFRIASKSSEGEVSGFSDFISEVTDKGKQGISWVWILSIIVAILAGFGIYLYIAYQKKIWPFKKNLKSKIFQPKADPPLAENPKSEIDNDIKELPGKKGRW